MGKKDSLQGAVFTAIWYYIVLTHNVGFLSLMVKPFLSKTGSATENVLHWVDLQILSPITWLLQHTNIILWASDQISPPSRSLWAELWCQNPLLSFSFLFFPPFTFQGFRLRIPTRAPPSHPCSPAPLHACTETDFYNSPADPPGEPRKARAWESALPECKLQSRSQSRRFWPPHTPWPTTVSLGQDRQRTKNWVKWRGVFSTADASQTKLI